ncbi:hypothetical protein [Staphylococcus warneri]|uniref:hypothetical protein n=1 Tax=Staphylococcus warneri TaxID=1292 RepID=UPI0005E8DAB9|nr:hypothetical protein [Staphylococcus warneri]COD89411.1 Uncharacterised protein [Staphylococcus warneri]
MEIIDCIIDSYEITYKVKTPQNHTLSIETPTYKAIEILKLLSEHVDKQPS